MMTAANLLFVTIESLCSLSSTLYFILWLHCISLESSYWMACLFHMTNHHQLRMCISIYPNLILNCGTIFTHCDIEIREPCQHCAYYILIRWLCLTVWWSSPGDIMQCFVDWVFPFNLLHGFLIQCYIKQQLGYATYIFHFKWSYNDFQLITKQNECVNQEMFTISNHVTIRS